MDTANSSVNDNVKYVNVDGFDGENGEENEGVEVEVETTKEVNDSEALSKPKRKRILL